MCLYYSTCYDDRDCPRKQNSAKIIWFQTTARSVWRLHIFLHVSTLTARNDHMNEIKEIHVPNVGSRLWNNLHILSVMYYTAVYRFGGELQDTKFYTLNLLDNSRVWRSLAYYLALFPVFTLSTNFPIISVTLWENIKVSCKKLVPGKKFPFIVNRTSNCSVVAHCHCICYY